jgi:hypothetical protein
MKRGSAISRAACSGRPLGLLVPHALVCEVEEEVDPQHVDRRAAQADVAIGDFQVLGPTEHVVAPCALERRAKQPLSRTMEPGRCQRTDHRPRGQIGARTAREPQEPLGDDDARDLVELMSGAFEPAAGELADHVEQAAHVKQTHAVGVELDHPDATVVTEHGVEPRQRRGDRLCRLEREQRLDQRVDQELVAQLRPREVCVGDVRVEPREPRDDLFALGAHLARYDLRRPGLHRRAFGTQEHAAMHARGERVPPLGLRGDLGKGTEPGDPEVDRDHPSDLDR